MHFSNSQTGGYTVLEVLIFLAVSALIFVGAVVSVGGQQSAVQYSQGMRDFSSKIADSINDVRNGYYPLRDLGRCDYDEATGAYTFSDTITAPNNGGSGRSQDCVYVGKTLVFNVNGDKDQFSKYSVVGRQIDGTKPFSPDTSDPELFAKIIPDPPTAVPRETYIEKSILRYGFVVEKIGDINDSKRKFESLSFMASNNIGNADSAVEGKININLYVTSGDANTVNETGFENSFQAKLTKQTSPVYICAVNPDKKYAWLVVQPNGNVDIEYDKDPC